MKLRGLVVIVEVGEDNFKAFAAKSFDAAAQEFTATSFEEASSNACKYLRQTDDAAAQQDAKETDTPETQETLDSLKDNVDKAKQTFNDLLS